MQLSACSNRVVKIENYPHYKIHPLFLKLKNNDSNTSNKQKTTSLFYNFNNHP